jgi:hypothetical protein
MKMTASGTTDVEIAVGKIADLVLDIGYRAHKGNGFIRTAMSGWTILLFVFLNKSIQMYFGLSREDYDHFDIKSANEFNEKNRFVKCYLSKEAIRFEHDFYFDHADGNARQLIERIFARWEISINIATEALNEAKQQAAKLTIETDKSK